MPLNRVEQRKVEPVEHWRILPEPKAMRSKLSSCEAIFDKLHGN
jgi:hypothetical protein